MLRVFVFFGHMFSCTWGQMVLPVPFTQAPKKAKKSRKKYFSKVNEKFNSLLRIRRNPSDHVFTFYLSKYVHIRVFQQTDVASLKSLIQNWLLILFIVFLPYESIARFLSNTKILRYGRKKVVCEFEVLVFFFEGVSLLASRYPCLYSEKLTCSFIFWVVGTSSPLSCRSAEPKS